ncbi:hypothetical protein LguiA_017199 [Lonicera macranthoides]
MSSLRNLVLHPFSGMSLLKQYRDNKLNTDSTHMQQVCAKAFHEYVPKVESTRLIYANLNKTRFYVSLLWSERVAKRRQSGASSGQPRNLYNGNALLNHEELISTEFGATLLFHLHFVNFTVAKKPRESLPTRIQRRKREFSHYRKVMQAINIKFNMNLDVPQIKNRYNVLKKEFGVVRALLKVSGFGWDDTKKMVVVGDKEWENYFADLLYSALRSGSKPPRLGYATPKTGPPCGPPRRCRVCRIAGSPYGP